MSSCMLMSIPSTVRAAMGVVEAILMAEATQPRAASVRDAPAIGSALARSVEASTVGCHLVLTSRAA